MPEKELHVLVVDDKPSNINVTQASLEVLGHTSEAASDGKEGLEKFKAGQFDLVITDLQMPKMGGERLAKEIRAISASTKIILATASPPKEVPEDINKVLTKPIRLNIFRSIISDLQ